MDSSVAFFVIFVSMSLQDSLNPYTFSMAVFLGTFLFLGRYPRKLMLLFGGSFLVSKFVVSSLFSLGLFEEFQYQGIYYWVLKRVGPGIGALAFVFGALNLYDWGKFKLRGTADRAIIKLPDSQSEGMKKLDRFSFAKSMFFMLLIGIVAACFEAGIVRKIYLPSIVEYLTLENLKIQAMFAVISYNVIQLLPFLYVFFCMFFMVSSKRFQEALSRNFSMAKIILAGLFLGLGIGLMYAGYLM